MDACVCAVYIVGCYFADLKVIKSARVMKKAVGHLIPFMETERLARNKALGLDPSLATDADIYNGTVCSCCWCVCSAMCICVYACSMETERLARNKALGLDPSLATDADIYNGTVCGCCWCVCSVSWCCCCCCVHLCCV